MIRCAGAARPPGRAVLRAALEERQVEDDDLGQALEDLLGDREAMTRSLLGVSPVDPADPGWS